MKRRSSYKLTFFDRHGAAGQHMLVAAGHATLAGGLSVAMFLVLGSQMLGLGGWRLLLFTLVCALTLAGLAAFAGLRIGSAAAGVSELIYMGGSTTPYEEGFSQQQALVMQRKYAEALELYEQRIADSPNEPRVRIAAADLYMTHGANPKRAADLYREVQRIPGVQSGLDVYVTNKLADLYLGALEEPGRALVEFRKLAHRYPGTPTAKHAVAAIANLKPRIVAGADPLPPDIWDPPAPRDQSGA
jgi:tetratricopeptide (TPR) repeat protein